MVVPKFSALTNYIKYLLHDRKPYMLMDQEFGLMTTAEPEDWRLRAARIWSCINFQLYVQV